MSHFGQGGCGSLTLKGKSRTEYKFWERFGTPVALMPVFQACQETTCGSVQATMSPFKASLCDKA
jgi:hypothetical protein